MFGNATCRPYFEMLLVCLAIFVRFNKRIWSFCGTSKGFMKALKAFIKPFEVPQRSVRIKI